MIFNIRGVDVSIDELKQDVQAAKTKGLSNKWAFTPETVETLLNQIEEHRNLLTATYTLLKKCHVSRNVENVMTVKVDYNEREGDGCSLMYDISELLNID